MGGGRDGVRGGLASGIVRIVTRTRVPESHCWTSQQWHPAWGGE
jgi:hypothetical protein